MIQNKYFLELKKIINNSYSPYSNFKTAAIIISDIGKYKGVNVENSAYPSGICAERSAIFNAVANGMKTIKELHLLTDSSKMDVIPCAACLQVLNEFTMPLTKIFVYNKIGKQKIYYFKELLPHSFSKKNLKK